MRYWRKQRGFRSSDRLGNRPIKKFPLRFFKGKKSLEDEAKSKQTTIIGILLDVTSDESVQNAGKYSPAHLRSKLPSLYSAKKTFKYNSLSKDVTKCQKLKCRNIFHF